VAPPNDLGPITPKPRQKDGQQPGVRQPDAAALQPNVGALIHDVARLIRRRFDRRARQTGLPLTRHQARTLLLIARNEGLRQAAVATLLDLEPIALVRMIDRLYEEGLVERRPHPTDRRVRTLWLTPLGWQAIDRVLAINAEIRKEACAGLSPAACEVLLGALGHLKENLLHVEEVDAIAAQ
jgi:DNA-binding MarR family transcriptional regulator